MQVGITGLPQAGATTLFNALTGAHVDVGGFHGERVDAGVVKVPDERLDALARIFEPEKIIPAAISFEDIGGVFSHLGAGGEHAARALAELRQADAILMVLSAFESPFVSRARGGIDPSRELRTMSEELLLDDLGVIEKRLDAVQADLKGPRTQREALEKERDLLRRCAGAIEEGKALSAVKINEAEEKMLRSYSLLTLKPRICVLNIGEDRIQDPPDAPGVQPAPIPICAELEMEIMQLDEDERQIFLEDAGLQEPAGGKIIRECYARLGLISFFTHVSGQLRAWTVEAGASAPRAAGKVHSDMEQGFIRAETVSLADLLECGSIKEAKAQGKVRMHGRDYQVQDGDVITFHFSR